jgi:hypothetical protein
MSAELNASNKNEMATSPSDEDPSALLLALSTSSTPDTFIHLLQKYLCPVLDTLPMAQKATVSDALSKAKHEYDRLADIFEVLDEHDRRLWSNESEEEGEMMHRIAKDILESLPTLWRTAVEDGIELEYIQCCLRKCTKMINNVKKSKSQEESGDINFKITITDTKNTMIFWCKHPPHFSLDVERSRCRCIGSRRFNKSHRI